MGAELPPWFKFRPTIVFSSPLFQAAMSDGALARAFLQVMSWSWARGREDHERDKLAILLAGGEATVACLEAHGVVHASTAGRVLVSLDWLDEARAEAFALRDDQRRAGKASAEARSRSRAGARGSVGSTPVERRLDAGSTAVQPGEEKRGDETRCPPSCQPTLREPSVPTAGEGAPDEGVRSKARHKRVAEVWQTVLARPEYDPLRRHAGFMAAWSQWIEWCGTRGAKARPPFGAQAAKMLNSALEDPEEYAAAIGRSIERNYVGVFTQTNARVRAGVRTDAPKVELATARAIELARLAVQRTSRGTES